MIETIVIEPLNKAEESIFNDIENNGEELMVENCFKEVLSKEELENINMDVIIEKLKEFKTADGIYTFDMEYNSHALILIN